MDNIERGRLYAKHYVDSKNFYVYRKKVLDIVGTLHADEAHTAWEAIDHFVDVYADELLKAP